MKNLKVITSAANMYPISASDYFVGKETVTFNCWLIKRWCLIYVGFNRLMAVHTSFRSSDPANYALGNDTFQ